mmetsp:Transcript_131579/g.420937  ORF Transcript_131579/g.420937 Transcript_131579/m.420937 type:complete len:242 (-) Transcript_131579:310-1035(-)
MPSSSMFQPEGTSSTHSHTCHGARGSSWRSRRRGSMCTTQPSGSPQPPAPHVRQVPAPTAPRTEAAEERCRVSQPRTRSAASAPTTTTGAASAPKPRKRHTRCTKSDPADGGGCGSRCTLKISGGGGSLGVRRTADQAPGVSQAPCTRGTARKRYMAPSGRKPSTSAHQAWERKHCLGWQSQRATTPSAPAPTSARSTTHSSTSAVSGHSKSISSTCHSSAAAPGPPANTRGASGANRRGR